jgi:mono/diheme cytochrome c family protein
VSRSLVTLLTFALTGCGAPSPSGKDAVQAALRVGTLTAREAAGHRVFVQRCATCHGPEGQGDGQNAYNLSPPPPDFREALAKVTPADRRRIIEGGTAAVGRSPLCPPWARSLSPEEIDALLAWLEVAAQRAPEAPRASRRR